MRAQHPAHTARLACTARGQQSVQPGAQLGSPGRIAATGERRRAERGAAIRGERLSPHPLKPVVGEQSRLVAGGQKLADDLIRQQEAELRG